MVGEPLFILEIGKFTVLPGESVKYLHISTPLAVQREDWLKTKKMEMQKSRIFTFSLYCTQQKTNDPENRFTWRKLQGKQ